MSTEPPVDRLELVALREKVATISEENTFVNELNDDLTWKNGELGIENEDLKKSLALAEERQKRFFDYWRCAEEELTKQIELNKELMQQLEAEKAKTSSAEQSEKILLDVDDLAANTFPSVQNNQQIVTMSQ
ncbi:uncharacterized protein FSUBG_10463 [Fusarium subglutinans]|uniref:Uncharacterized protein n=1 Tax=Gibberella subglutinans TaxID=42677 RepID=A0A8H5P7J2_GIBSU|nr:uncharacterized protein FSUBG_10463 [Fusarium subglutinans]KAF5591537.1 hypothetical protein FSUBG_10463 [Fusarium subglutinans]